MDGHFRSRRNTAKSGDTGRTQRSTQAQRWRAFFANCPYDRLNERLIRVSRILAQTGEIKIFGERSDEVRTETEEWLERHGVFYDVLLMRPAGDLTPDEELKRRWLDEIKDRSRILAVFEIGKR